MKKQISASFILLMFAISQLLQGCGGVSPLATPIREIPSFTPSATNTATRIPRPTQDLRPTHQPTPTIPSYPTTQPINIVSQCLTLTEDTSKLPRKNYGTIVIAPFGAEKWVFPEFKTAYFWNFPFHQRPLFPNRDDTFNSTFAVSPNFRFLAYLDYQKQDKSDDWSEGDTSVVLSILDQTGKVVKKDALLWTNPGGRPRIVTWTPQGILIAIQKVLGFGQSDDNVIEEYVLIDPVTMSQKLLLPDLRDKPENAEYPSAFFHYDLERIYYSPSLSHVLYHGLRDFSHVLYYSIQDTWSQRQVNELGLAAYSHRGEIVWDPNDQFVLVPVWLAHGGEPADSSIMDTEQIGVISLYTDGSRKSELPANAFHYSISPDSNKIAYWLSNDHEFPSLTLHILDRTNGKTTDTCLKTSEVVKTIWSPDSQNLALAFEYHGGEITVLADLEQKIALKIEDVSQPVAWLK